VGLFSKSLINHNEKIETFNQEVKREIENLFSKTNFFVYEDFVINGNVLIINDQFNYPLFNISKIDSRSFKDNTDYHKYKSSMFYSNVKDYVEYKVHLPALCISTINQNDDQKKRFVMKDVKEIKRTIDKIVDGINAMEVTYK
jgi:hypothetical protein